MDNLQWFKFNPSNWIMGKIQRCPEDTQARFIRLCCLYWNKSCEMSVEDSIIEIDENHFNTLVSKKVLMVADDSISILFLDTQWDNISKDIDKKSISGKIGNLKRWRPELYKLFKDGKKSLSDCVTIANESHPDRTPIAEQSQNIAEKRRGEEIREDKIIKEKRKIFVPPSFEELRSFEIEKQYSNKAENFINFYESKGWQIGKNKMKSWKAARTTWFLKDEAEKQSQKPKNLFAP